MSFQQTLRTTFTRAPAAGATVGFLAVFVVFATLRPDTFLSHGAFSSFLSSQAVAGIVAIGVTMLMISGEFDLSVGSILGVSSLAFLYAAVNGVPILIAAFLGLVAGALLGLVNGLLLVWTRIPSFIVTLGTMLVFRAVSLTAISGGRIIRYADYSRNDPTISLSPFLLVIASSLLVALVVWSTLPVLRRARRHLFAGGGASPGYRALLATAAALAASLSLLFVAVTGTTQGTPVSVSFFDILNGRIDIGARGANYRAAIAWWLALTAIFAVVLLRTRFGNAVFATGGNPEAARVQGINIDRVRITNFVLSGTLAAFAGIVQVARLKSVDPLRGENLELEVIASVVIGGTLLSGGFGSIVGSAIGSALTGMLRTGLVLVNVPSNAFRGAIGAIMIGAVVLNTLVRRER